MQVAFADVGRLTNSKNYHRIVKRLLAVEKNIENHFLLRRGWSPDQ